MHCDYDGVHISLAVHERTRSQCSKWINDDATASSGPAGDGNAWRLVKHMRLAKVIGHFVSLFWCTLRM